MRRQHPDFNKRKKFNKKECAKYIPNPHIRSNGRDYS